jgi:hypothetical protein
MFILFLLLCSIFSEVFYLPFLTLFVSEHLALRFLVFALNQTYFFEPFDDDTLGTRWIPSKSSHFNGSLAIEERINEVYELGNKGYFLIPCCFLNVFSCLGCFFVGLVMKTAKAVHGVTAKLNARSHNQDLVVQVCSPSILDPDPLFSLARSYFPCSCILV